MITVPFTGSNQQVDYAIVFPSPVNLVGATVTTRVQLRQRGAAGEFGVWAESNIGTKSDFGGKVALAALPLDTWTELTYTPAASFSDAATSARFNINISSLTLASAATTTIWIDKITAVLAGAGTAPGPFLFNTDIAAVAAGPFIDPSTLAATATWLQ